MTRLAHWLPPVLWMSVVFWLSTDSWSSEHTRAILLPWLAWLLPGAAPEHLQVIHGLARKLGHVTEYGILGALWFRTLTRGGGVAPRASAAIAVGLSVAWAAVDESHQSTLPSRTGSAVDVMIDSGGAFLAVAVVLAGWRAFVDRATSVLLWIAALGGAATLVVDGLAGVRSGVLWVTVPGAALALVVRRAWRHRG